MINLITLIIYTFCIIPFIGGYYNKHIFWHNIILFVLSLIYCYLAIKTLDWIIVAKHITFTKPLLS